MDENRSITRAGSKIRYWLDGESNNPVVVLTHGATLDHMSFQNQIPALVKNGYRVLTWDMRGHGASVPMGRKATLQVHVEDLLAIMDHAGVAKATLVGHSLGGFVSQLFTYQHPERVEALAVLGCTDISQKPKLFYRGMYLIMPRILRKMHLESFRERTLEELSIKDSVKEYARAAMNHIPKDDFIKIIMSGVEALWTESGVPADHKIPVPFLLMHGDSDNANGKVYQKESPEWEKRQPNCSYQTVPEAGHTAQMDNPEGFNDILMEFLNQEVI